VSNFHVGQRVICVDARMTNLLFIAELRKRRIYTVKAVDEGGALHLVEFDRIAFWNARGIPGEPRRVKGFAARRFRPVVINKGTAEADLHLFTPWLKVGEEA
jgi:hypothetical protein